MQGSAVQRGYYSGESYRRGIPLSLSLSLSLCLSLSSASQTYPSDNVALGYTDTQLQRPRLDNLSLLHSRGQRARLPSLRLPCRCCIGLLVDGLN